jgi:hypothetical protein
MSDQKNNVPQLEQPPSGQTAVQWFQPDRGQGFPLLNLDPENKFLNRYGQEQDGGFKFGVGKGKMLLDGAEDLLWFVSNFENQEIDDPDSIAQPPSGKTSIRAFRGKLFITMNPEVDRGFFNVSLNNARATLEHLEDVDWFVEKYGKPVPQKAVNQRRGPATTPAKLSEEKREEMRKKIEQARARAAAAKTSDLVKD